MPFTSLSRCRPYCCHDNAVAEGFFSLLKAKKIKRKIYPTHNEARAEMFNYIEFFYNRNRHHGNNDGLSPVEYEQRHFEKLSAVYRTGGILGRWTPAFCRDA